MAANVETLDEETQLIIAQLNEILAGRRNTDGISFKKVDMNTLNRTTAKMKRVTELIETTNITQTNNLIEAAGVWVADQLGLKKYKGGKRRYKAVEKGYQHSRNGKERANWCTQRG